MSTDLDRDTSIRHRAYANWLRRADGQGSEMEDWLLAERDIEAGGSDQQAEANRLANPEPKTSDSPESAPESGTATDATSGNQPARPQERPASLPKSKKTRARKDDPAVAGEER